MVEYTQELENIKLITYNEIANLSDKVTAYFESLHPRTITFRYNFQCNNMSCAAESIKDFKELTYGASDFRLISMQIMAHFDSKEHIRINYLLGYSVSASSKVMLSDFVQNMNFNAQKREENEISEAVLIERNISSDNSKTIVATGKNIIIGSTNSSINDVENKEIKKLEAKEKYNIKTFLRNTFESIAGNAIWWGIGVILTLIFGYSIII